MSEKIRLLELASNKVATDSGFMAFVLKIYLGMENISREEVISNLQCSVEDYYRLSLCKVPDIDASDFVSRLNEIAKYSNSSATELNRIIKRVNSVLKLDLDRVAMMAARDKQKKDKS